MKISAGSVDHDQLGGVSTDDHHAIQHAIDSGASHTGDITNTQHGTISQSNAHAHANLSSVTSDQHHAQAHTLASHSSEAHSELSSVGVNDHHAQTHSHSSHSSVGVNDHHAQTHASTHVPGGADTMAVDASAGTGSLRTLGTGSTQAALGNHTHASTANIVTGTYTGDGSTGQTITVSGVDLSSHGLIMIFKRYTSDTDFGILEAILSSPQINDDFGGTEGVIDLQKAAASGITQATGAAAITAFSDGSFTVGDLSLDYPPNKSGEVYNYIAIGRV